MVLLLTAMTSFGLIVFGVALIAVTLRDSGAAVLSALAGETQRVVVRPTAQASRTVRIRTSSFAQQVAQVQHMRVAA